MSSASLRRLVATMRRQGPDVADTPPLDYVFGVVSSIQSGSANSLTISIGAGATLVTGVRYAKSYSPTVGDQVVIHTLGTIPWVIGTTA